MLKDEVAECIANINWWTIYESTIDGAINRILGEYIYNPFSQVSGSVRVSQIREALASDETLNEIGVPDHARWPEEKLRKLLTQLAERVEYYELNGVPKRQDFSELFEKIEELRPLVQPLTKTSVLSEAIRLFEEEILPGLNNHFDRSNVYFLIRYVLFFDTSVLLPKFFTSEVTDTVFREYLRNIGWKIFDLPYLKF
jgi:hypothetical protein